MRIVCLIPARGGSKGIPNKNVYQIAGKPLLTWSIDAVSESKYINGEIYVTSNSDEIIRLATANGAHGIRRPDEISGDKASSESALVHAYEQIVGDSGVIDYIVFLQPTSPIRDKDDVDNAIEQIINEGADSLFSSRPLQDFCLWSKKSDNSFESKNFDYKNRRPRQEWETTYLENGSLYIFKPEVLLKGNNRLGGRITTYEMDYPRSLQIDNMEDIALCEYFLEQSKK
jgi:CMP-N,N'-diacetyllegionaminic acid synthase